MRRAAMLLVLLAACGQDPAICALDPYATGEDATLRRRWPAGTRLQLVADASFACTDQLAGALERLESHGIHAFKGGRSAVSVPLTQVESFADDRAGSTWVRSLDGVIQLASVSVLVCDEMVLEHELLHALGFGHNTRPGSLMHPNGGSFELSAAEVLTARTALGAP